MLTVETGSELAEVFLIDAAFELVRRGVGRLDSRVPVGLYKIKARLGDTTVEQLIPLDSDREVNLKQELSFAAAAPLDDTTRTHEWQEEAAERASAGPHVRKGQGARILIMARRWTSKERTVLIPGLDPPARGVSLRTRDGEVVVDLEKDATAENGGPDPYAACAVEVDPGAYVLRWHADRDMEVEQTLYANQSWQTQAFLLRDASGLLLGDASGAGDTGAAGSRGSERTDITILMTHGNFDPRNHLLRLIEEARLALADERQVGSEMVKKALRGKFTDPMLGLLGAHLMLLARGDAQPARRREKTSTRLAAPVRFDQGLFNLVVRNLRWLLGSSHSDVVALATQATDPSLADLGPIKDPPMLWRSWPLLVEASNERPELVSEDLPLRLADILPMRPYLVWKQHPSCVEYADLLSRLQKAVGLGRKEPEQAGYSSQRDLPVPADAFNSTPDEFGNLGKIPPDRQRMSRQLLMPRAVINDVLDSPIS